MINNSLNKYVILLFFSVTEIANKRSTPRINDNGSRLLSPSHEQFSHLVPSCSAFSSSFLKKTLKILLVHNKKYQIYSWDFLLSHLPGIWNIKIPRMNCQQGKWRNDSNHFYINSQFLMKGNVLYLILNSYGNPAYSTSPNVLCCKSIARFCNM